MSWIYFPSFGLSVCRTSQRQAGKQSEKRFIQGDSFN
jgi:hypothetical protein